MNTPIVNWEKVVLSQIEENARLTAEIEKLRVRLSAFESLSLKAHAELEAGYETCGYIVDLKNLALKGEV